MYSLRKSQIFSLSALPCVEAPLCISNKKLHTQKTGLFQIPDLAAKKFHFHNGDPLPSGRGQKAGKTFKKTSIGYKQVFIEDKKTLAPETLKHGSIGPILSNGITESLIAVVIIVGIVTTSTAKSSMLGNIQLKTNASSLSLKKPTKRQAASCKRIHYETFRYNLTGGT